MHNKYEAFCKHGYHINIWCMQCEAERKKPVDDNLDDALWGALKNSARLKSKGRLHKAH